MRLCSRSICLVLLLCVAPAAAKTGDPEPNAKKSELLELANEAVKDAIALRGLSAKAPVHSEVVSKEQVEKYVLQRFDETGAKKSVDTLATALQLLGLLPENAPLQAIMIDVLREQIAGYYDPEKKTLYVADWLPGFMQKPTLVHEVTHALQDQHFDILRFMDGADGYGEAYGAIACLIEGDATLVMFDQLISSMGVEVVPPELMDTITDQVMGVLEHQLADVGGMEKLPRVLRQSLVFPYIGGLRLALAARRAGGWAQVNALYDAVPLSTEQILHPEKLLGEERDHPCELTVRLPPSTARSGWSEGGTDTIGELGWRLIFEETMDREVAHAAAAGWDGDRFVLLHKEGSGEKSMVWASVWDSVADAKEAESALATMRSPPRHSLRSGKRVVAVWGNSLPRMHQLATFVMRTVQATEIRSFRFYEQKAREQRQRQSPDAKGGAGAGAP